MFHECIYVFDIIIMHIFLASLFFPLEMIYKADFSRLSLTMGKIIVKFVICHISLIVEWAEDFLFSKLQGLCCEIISGKVDEERDV